MAESGKCIREVSHEKVTYVVKLNFTLEPKICGGVENVDFQILMETRSTFLTTGKFFKKVQNPVTVVRNYILTRLGRKVLSA